MDNYAAPHAWNLVAKIIRNLAKDANANIDRFGSEVDRDSTKRHLLSYKSALYDIALAFAERFREDEGFNPLTWLDKCSPDSETEPWSELWEEN